MLYQINECLKRQVVRDEPREMNSLSENPRGHLATQLISLEQAYQLVEGHRNASRLEAAEHVARQILEARPGESRAIHYLGIVAHQRGQLAAAIEHVRKAVALSPEVALF